MEGRVPTSIHSCCVLWWQGCTNRGSTTQVLHGCWGCLGCQCHACWHNVHQGSCTIGWVAFWHQRSGATKSERLGWMFVSTLINTFQACVLVVHDTSDSLVCSHTLDRLQQEPLSRRRVCWVGCCLQRHLLSLLFKKPLHYGSCMCLLYMTIDGDDPSWHQHCRAYCNTRCSALMQGVHQGRAPQTVCW